MSKAKEKEAVFDSKKQCVLWKVNNMHLHILVKSLVSIFICTNSFSTPLVSIITSVYKGDVHIEGFMRNITRQTIFDQCELIMINPNSPDNEEKIIQEYMKIYQNIKYLKLDHDPGLYAVWNIAIKMAQAAYITNANLDDRLKSDCYEIHVQTLEKNPEVDLVYSDYYVTYKPNETFEENSHAWIGKTEEFSKDAIIKACLPNNHPMWRKAMHEKYGFFNEEYRSAGDWEMWLRAVKGGSQFLKVQGIYGLFYCNHKGLSNNPKNPLILQEEKEIYRQYKDLAPHKMKITHSKLRRYQIQKEGIA